MSNVIFLSRTYSGPDWGTPDPLSGLLLLNSGYSGNAEKFTFATNINLNCMFAGVQSYSISGPKNCPKISSIAWGVNASLDESNPAAILISPYLKFNTYDNSDPAALKFIDVITASITVSVIVGLQ